MNQANFSKMQKAMLKEMLTGNTWAQSVQAMENGKVIYRNF